MTGDGLGELPLSRGFSYALGVPTLRPAEPTVWVNQAVALTAIDFEIEQRDFVVEVNGTRWVDQRVTWIPGQGGVLFRPVKFDPPVLIVPGDLVRIYYGSGAPTVVRRVRLSGYLLEPGEY